jgi:GNAT superfamily N-acetyltransferase
MTAVLVRCAVPEDAAVAVAVLRDSITKLCVADHRNDPHSLEPWLRNKTVENFSRWLNNAENYVVVAELDSAILGVASVHNSGEIRLCYVRPGRQRFGIGAALLAAVETHAIALGVHELTLKSSVGARAFYEHHGYTPAGAPTPGFGSSLCFPYKKAVAPRSEPLTI